MNNHRKRQILWLLTAITATGAITSLVVAFTLPYLPQDASNHPTTPLTNTTITSNNTASQSRIIPQATLRKAKSLDLRKPLFDPPPPPEVKKPRPPLRIKLQATMVEPGNSMAMITGSDGKTTFKTIGDVIDNAEIIEITETQITVRYHDELVPILIEKTPGSSSGGRRRRR